MWQQEIFVEKANSFYSSVTENRQNGIGLIDEDEIICGLVLAGGDGKRLQPFIKSLGKGNLPKQYVNFTGNRSMLEHTLERAEKIMPPERVLTVITESHLQFPEVRQQCSTRPKDTVIVQPENKETCPGILLPLIHLYKRYPESVVLVFPSDHFIGQNDRLVDHARLACLAVRQDPSQLVLLGVTPDREEPEYGYLLPGKKPVALEPNLSPVSWFIEKPERKTVRRLIRAGGLWNTMIMAFKTRAMLHWMSRLVPSLYHRFQEVHKAIGTAAESDVIRKTYRELRPLNFSKEFLEPMVKDYPSSLVVLPVQNLLWSDWGTANRIIDVLAKIGDVPRQEGARRIAAKNTTRLVANNSPAIMESAKLRSKSERRCFDQSFASFIKT
jgi:mannose-1-phosphate guanylyltransferase